MPNPHIESSWVNSAKTRLAAFAVSSKFPNVQTIGLCLLAVWTLATTLIVIAKSYTPLPLFDYWGYWRSVQDHQLHFLRQLFAQNSEHRIAIPRLLFLIDQHVFHGTSVFLLVCSFTLQLASAGLFLWLAIHRGALSFVSRVNLAAALLTCLFTAQQFTNFTWGFQVQFIMVYFAGVAAFTALYAGAQRPTLSLGVTIGLAFVASYSMANGLFVWPWLLILGLWLQVSWRRLGILAACGAFAWWLYFQGYFHPANTADPIESILQMPRVLAFLVSYLGAPAEAISNMLIHVYGFEEHIRTVLSSVVGVLGVIAAVSVVAKVVRAREPGAAYVLLTTLGFLFTTAVLTSLGRINGSLLESLTSRYATPAWLFWATLLVLYWPDLKSRLTFVIVALFLTVAIQQTSWILYARDYMQVIGEGEAAIASGVYDRDVWGHIWGGTLAEGQGVPERNYLKAHRLSIFHGRDNWLGDRLRTHFSVVDGSACEGRIETVKAIDSAVLPGSKAVGWVWDRSSRKVPAEILLVDLGGRIVGFGRAGFARQDIRQSVALIQSDYAGWVGYVPGKRSRPITAYAITNGGKSVCPFATAFMGASRGALTDIGPALPNMPSHVTGTFVRDGMFPDVGKPFAGRPVFGSWAGSDQNKGTISFGPFAAGETPEILLPLVTGPATQGTSIKLIESDSGKVLESLDPPPVVAKWDYLRFPINPENRKAKLAIVVEDNGNGWGQWIAVGEPSLPH